MNKKITSSHRDPNNLPRHLREGLVEAENLLSKKKAQDALDLLLELERKFPHNSDVFGLMANAYLDLQNQRGYLHALYKLHNLLPNRADIKAGLAGAYLSNGRMALALRTFRQFLKNWPKDERAADVMQMLPQLESAMTEILSQFDFTLETGLDFACKHEELQVLMELGNFERCKQLAKALLAQRPDFVPVLNNLSQIAWMEGNLTAAVETSRKVLDVQPDNVHALSNLTRFLSMTEKREESLVWAKQLKESTADAADRWIKLAEAFSFIENDEDVLALVERARQAGEYDGLDGVFWHWCAVAEYRRGNLSQARANWKKCLKLAPYFSLAAGNLEELKKPVYERICPQAFSMETWLSQKTIKDLSEIIEQSTHEDDDRKIRVKLKAFLQDHPEILYFIPAALAAGDELCRGFALQLADMISHPTALELLKEFALGQAGPDSLRTEAAQILSKHGIFESGQMVDLWLNGKQTALMMLGFEITAEASDASPLKPGVLPLMEQAVGALQRRDGAAAEGYLRKAIKIQPDEPSLLNNLGFAFALQDKKAEADSLADQIAERFPDYFFGQVIAARKAVHANDLEKAKAILDRLMKKQRLHVSEFGALCGSQIDLLVADEKPEAAVTWFQIWKQGYPDDPALKNYEKQMAMIEGLVKLKGDVFNRAKPRKRAK